MSKERTDLLPWTAILAYQKGRWVIQDVGYEVPGLLKQYYSTNKDPDNILRDWWTEFGGE